ncbi:hypothetical protein T492DRAFT_860734, partial [Pavlovales sp. CCMP2436]
HRATTDLVRSYIRNENCLVLCVLPSGVATLRGSPILTIMEEVATSSPTLWERTIVILTKVDTGDRARLANRLRPGACELACIPARQIVPVINRSVGDPRSIIDALEDERRWFRDWYIEFNPADMGVDGMLSHLERMVNSHIVRVWVPQQLKVLGQDPAELSADVLVRAVAEAARCAMLRECRKMGEKKFDGFVGFDEHALVLRRFGGLKEQLLGRVDSALAQDTARLRELLRQRAELVCAVDHSGPGAFPDGAVKLFIVQ